MVKLVNSVFGLFNRRKHTISICIKFANLSEVFGTVEVDHAILMEKIQLYGIPRNYPNWFKSQTGNSILSVKI